MCQKPVIVVGDAWFDNCLVNREIGFFGGPCVWAFEVK